LLCCRLGSRKKRALALRNRQKLYEINNQPDGKIPILPSNEQTKEIILTTKPIMKDENIKDSKIDPNLRDLPADIRLNMLTGITDSFGSRSLTSSRMSLG